jgi:hypothetical protein
MEFEANHVLVTGVAGCHGGGILEYGVGHRTTPRSLATGKTLHEFEHPPEMVLRG